MQIVHVIASMERRRGGPPAVVENLAVEQAKKGHGVRVIAAHGDFDTGTPAEVALIPERNSSDVRQTLESADVIHLHGVWDRLIYNASIAARKLRKPYAIAPHGMLDPWSLSQKTIKKKIALMLGYRNMLNSAKFLHCLNSEEVGGIAPLKLQVDCEILANGISPDEFSQLPQKGAFYRNHPELQGRPFVLFLGRLHHKKGLDFLIRSFERVAASASDATLVIAGPDDGMQAWIESRLASGDLRARVFLVGPLYGRDKLAALVEATVFCLPSRQEGFSVAILEAMACETPVVISRECNFPEVGDYGAGTVVSLEDAAIAHALSEFLNNPSLAKQTGERARELVFSRYTWPRIADRSLEIYGRHAS